MRKYLYFIFPLFLFSCGLENSKNLLSDSQWELYGYRNDGLTVMMPLTDILVFNSSSNYTFNGTQNSYDVIELSTGNETIRLWLEDTRFGTISGIVAVESIKQGGILGDTFTRAVDEEAWQLWFRRID